MSLIFSITGNSYAASSTPAPIVATNPSSTVFIQRGSEAPFDGYLFPPEKAISIKKELMELDEFRKLADSYQKSIDDYKKNEDLYNFKVNTLLDQNDKLSNALYKKEDRDSFENKFYFVLGVILTSSAVYLATKMR